MQNYFQKKADYEFTFEFKEDELVYRAKDSTSDSTVKIPYVTITSKKWDFIRKNDWFRNVGLIWVLIGFLLEIPTLVSGSYSLPIWLPLGIGFLAYYYYQQVKITVIEAEREKILIVKNQDHDEICKTILSRRNDALKDLYGKVTPENGLDNEVKKFKILFDDQVINEAEFEQAMLEIEKFKKQPIPSPLSL